MSTYYRRKRRFIKDQPNILHTKINENNHRTLSFTDLNATYIIITDIIIHAKVFSVNVMSVIIVTDKV